LTDDPAIANSPIHLFNNESTMIVRFMCLARLIIIVHSFAGNQCTCKANCDQGYRKKAFHKLPVNEGKSKLQKKPQDDFPKQAYLVTWLPTLCAMQTGCEVEQEETRRVVAATSAANAIFFIILILV
jgi:hypothetical protein